MAAENATFLEADVAVAFVVIVFVATAFVATVFVATGFVATAFVAVGKGIEVATGDATEGEFCDAGDDDAAATASAAAFLAFNLQKCLSHLSDC